MRSEFIGACLIVEYQEHGFARIFGGEFLVFSLFIYTFLFLSEEEKYIITKNRELQRAAFLSKKSASCRLR